MRLAELVECAAAVAATRSRSVKIDALATLLRSGEPQEAHIVAPLLAGDPRQGRVGVGWATARTLPNGTSTKSTLSVTDLDEMLEALASSTGQGSTQQRSDILESFASAATVAETDFVRRLLIGELRQGASEGILIQSVARAAGVPGGLARQALMLTGDLGETAAIALSGGRAGLEAVGFQLMDRYVRCLQPRLQTLHQP